MIEKVMEVMVKILLTIYFVSWAIVPLYVRLYGNESDVLSSFILAVVIPPGILCFLVLIIEIWK